MKKSGLLLKLIGYLKKEKYRIGLITILLFVINGLSLLIPTLTGQIIDLIDLHLSVGNTSAWRDIFKMSGSMLVIALGVWGLSAIQNILAIKVSQNTVLQLRHDTFKQLMHLPIRYFDKNTKGNIISIITTDINHMSESISNDMTVLLNAVFTVVGALYFMVQISWKMSLVFVVTVPTMFLVSRIISKASRRLFRQKKQAYGGLVGYTEEMITAQKTIKVYGIECYNEEQFIEKSRALCDIGQRAEYNSSLMMPSMNFIGHMNVILICAIGIYLVLEGGISIGEISGFVLYSKRFSAPIVNMASLLNSIQITMAACERVFGILDYDKEKTECIDAKSNKMNLKGEVTFEKVTFGYDEQKMILKDINLEIKAGEKIAIVGETGSGKSTFINLLMRFYDVSSGQIKMDGRPIGDYPLEDLRARIAMILQESWLFTGSVYDNIVYALPEEKRHLESVQSLCKQIQVDDFIQSLPGGYHFILQGESQALSTGQRQLLSIIRTFLCQPDIFILDEATSAIDPQMEQEIKAVTDRVIEGKTSFIIAHRLSTIKDADRILVMKNGSIVESGQHEDLLAREGVYWEIYQSQFAS